MDLNSLRNNFKSILTIKNNINICNNKISQKINQLEKIYNTIIEKNRKADFLIGLDTFHFQKIILKYDQKDLDKYYKLVVNRIYSNYYKLSKIIIKYVKKNIIHKNLEKTLTDLKTFEKYDNLDIFKDYGFEKISNLYKDILRLISIMAEYCVEKEIELATYKKSQNSGISINNFVITLENDILTVRNQIKLYVNYIDFYISFHSTYLKRYLNKLKLALTYINKDIKLEVVEEKIEEKDPFNILVKKIEDGNETSEESEVEESITVEENITAIIERPDIITDIVEHIVETPVDSNEQNNWTVVKKKKKKKRKKKKK